MAKFLRKDRREKCSIIELRDPLTIEFRDPLTIRDPIRGLKMNIFNNYYQL